MQEFAKTPMGRKFFERTMPDLIKAVNNLTTALNKEPILKSTLVNLSTLEFCQVAYNDALANNQFKFIDEVIMKEFWQLDGIPEAFYRKFGVIIGHPSTFSGSMPEAIQWATSVLAGDELVQL